jgi:hypothetical protein
MKKEKILIFECGYIWKKGYKLLEGKCIESFLGED